ncbi:MULTISPECIES: hypothetical protein [Halorussus]|uniref:hypothetical protein n=1 Tax=Halorussus TaxID=1070314 RepID=UPI0020A0A80D|nr:hypothetical protein [Halorussus vallis]USZ74778.1 hypothetical protein NGM07_15210 [Halorussus vallis]
MDVSDVSSTQRFAAGIVLVVVAPMLGQPNLGLLTRIAGIGTFLGIGLLGAALEPPMTRALGADEWSDLSTAKQVPVLFVLAIAALVLWFGVGVLEGVVASAM